MPFDVKDLFLAGGFPIVLVSAFIAFLWQTHKDFIAQLGRHETERKETYTLFSEERQRVQQLFITALENHCTSVQRSLELQERALSELVSQIKIFGEQIGNLKGK